MIRQRHVGTLGVVTGTLVLFPAVWIALFLSAERLRPPSGHWLKLPTKCRKARLKGAGRLPRPGRLGSGVFHQARCFWRPRIWKIPTEPRKPAAPTQRASGEHSQSRSPPTFPSSMNEAHRRFPDRRPRSDPELFRPQDPAEVRGLIAKASRVRIASKELELRTRGRMFYGAVTVSSLIRWMPVLRDS